MRRKHARARKAARRFIEAQDPVAAPDELPALLARTAEHLAEFMFVDDSLAHELALSAWSDIQGERTRCYVDLDLSTPHLLFLVDPIAGVRRPVPVIDLVRILGPRVAA